MLPLSVPASAESRDRDKTQPEAGGGRGGTRGISVSRVKSADAEGGREELTGKSENVNK